MFEKLTNADERGQVGIETLIIFIAMILVAAIAAGILINTAGFLQNKAEATSHDSTEQVSNQVLVIAGTGSVDGTENITDLNLTVMQSPGADEIDLAESTIEYTGPSASTTLKYVGSTSTDGFASNSTFGVYGVKDDGDSAPVLNSKSDRFKVQISLGGPDGDALESLEGGEEATLRIVTQSGSMYTFVANAPESLSSDANGEVEV